MRAADLAQLAALLSKASAVVALEEIHAGDHEPTTVALRHDIDDNRGSLVTAVKMARWEAERGYRSTYFVLHGSSYWADRQAFRAAVEEIAEAGHEIGLHANGLAEALRTGRDPHEILEEALAELRGLGVPVQGVAGHGDPICGQAEMVNDEQFVECARPNMGAPDRTLSYGAVTLKMAPRPLAYFGFSYEALRLSRGHYQSDSGGQWFERLEQTIAGFPYEGGPLQVLQHSDWWHDAFTRQPERALT